MIFWGWLRQPTILGAKLDQCPGCGTVGPHILVRHSYWLHLFRIPIVLLWLRHGLICSGCGKETDVSFLQARRAFKIGSLPLPDRSRPASAGLIEDVWQETGRRPTEAELFDPLQRNPSRGGFDLYTKVWPVLAAAFLAFVILMPRQVAQLTGAPEQYGAAHTCWQEGTDTVVGCRMADGHIEGTTTSTTVTCYFDEPISDPENGVLKCR